MVPDECLHLCACELCGTDISRVNTYVPRRAEALLPACVCCETRYIRSMGSIYTQDSALFQQCCMKHQAAVCVVQAGCYVYVLGLI